MLKFCNMSHGGKIVKSTFLNLHEVFSPQNWHNCFQNACFMIFFVTSFLKIFEYFCITFLCRYWRIIYQSCFNVNSNHVKAWIMSISVTDVLAEKWDSNCWTTLRLYYVPLRKTKKSNSRLKLLQYADTTSSKVLHTAYS